MWGDLINSVELIAAEGGGEEFGEALAEDAVLLGERVEGGGGAGGLRFLKAQCERAASKMDVATTPYDVLRAHYDEVLNRETATRASTNDEPTPIALVEEILGAVPAELWRRRPRVLDPCCGHGNFGLVAYRHLRAHLGHADAVAALRFNDVNEARLAVVRALFPGAEVTRGDFLASPAAAEYDLVMANPPYARLMADGRRGAKNHHLVHAFVEHALRCVRADGYLAFLVPDNWMSFADRNALPARLSALQFVRLDIHSAKRHFPRVGSSFTWWVVQNRAAEAAYDVTGVWRRCAYTARVPPSPRAFVPLYYTDVVESLLRKTIDGARARFAVETSSDLHAYTKRALLRPTREGAFVHRVVHTPTQTLWASRPHKYQEGPKVFLSLTNTYRVWVDACGMTQSVAFVRCADAAEAQRVARVLAHPLYRFLNDICRWGNFNSVRLLQRLPVPEGDDVAAAFGCTREEVALFDAQNGASAAPNDE